MRLAKNISLLGLPENPYFEKETIEWVYRNETVVIQQNYSRQTNRHYRYPYCMMDARTQTNQGAPHVKEHTQIDHKRPSSVIANTNAYDAGINELIVSGRTHTYAAKINWNDATQTQATYNNLDNL